MRPDAAPGLIGSVLLRLRLRLSFVAIAAGVLAGSVVAAILQVGGGSTRWPGLVAAILAAGSILGLRWRRQTRARAALAIEQVRSCRNVVVTAEELERDRGHVPPVIAARVFAESARAVEGLGPGSVVSLRAPALALAGSLGVALLVIAGGGRSVREAVVAVSDRLTGGSQAGVVRVLVEPPSYAGRPAFTLTDPNRIEALEGSRIRFDTGDHWRIRFGKNTDAVEFVARESGYFAMEAAAGDRRLIPLNVVHDRAPAVRIESPAKDLLLPDGNRSIPVAMSASDDLALERLELRYTKVSGSGEQFEFVEGSVPVALQRTSTTEWRGNVSLGLSALRLGPGDSLVYRAVARDRRPGEAGLASSDTYFVEISGPGQVALEGVEMPPELERYAMSQQMIVLKLERLRSRAATLARAAVIEESASIAAEQRTVRANFVFLLGGHVEDEEVEAEQSHEIQEGRLENTARKDINTAVSHMTRVEQGLTAVRVAEALPPARAAVEALQRAFGRSRYLLRSLAVRSRLDPSRRLTGDLEGAADWRRVPVEAGERPGDKARELLARLIASAGDVQAGRTLTSDRRHQLAEMALTIDPASALWQDVSRRLLDDGDLEALEQVIARISPELRQTAVPRTPLAAPESALLKAFKAERRQ